MHTFKKTIIYLFCLINLSYLVITFLPNINKVNLPIINPVSSATVLASKSSNTVMTDLEVSEEDYKEYNILLLGLDARKGDDRPRCDAIHIFSFSPATDYLRITSIPRGTRIELANVSTQSAYLANNCHLNGIENTINKIEKISDLEIDAYITVGFSQVLGILRSMNLPTSSTLQYLRNRRYGIGDYQRSHNQANFLKDMILSYFWQFYKLPVNFREFIFNTIDGNLDFSTANYLIEAFARKKIYLSSDNIILISKPERSKYVKEIHLEVENEEFTLGQNDEEYKTYQIEMETYLNNLIKTIENDVISGHKNRAYTKLKIPFNQKLWLQIDNEEVRDEIHYRLVEVYVNCVEDVEKSKYILEEYKNELKLFNKTKYLQKAEDLGKSG